MLDCTVTLSAYHNGAASRLVRAVREVDGREELFKVDGCHVERIEASRNFRPGKVWFKIRLEAISPIARASIRAAMQPSALCLCASCQ